MAKLKKIAKASDIKPGTAKTIRLRNVRIAVFNVDGEFIAIRDSCPHRGAPLSDGPVQGPVVTCTWHGWEFNLKRGCHVIDEDVRLEKFPLTQQKGWLYIDPDVLPPVSLTAGV